MRLDWKISASDARRLRQFVDSELQNNFVKSRIHRNVIGSRPPTSKDRFWRALVLCLLTSQQRSGPDSPVNELLSKRPFPLSHRRLKSKKRTVRYVRSILRQHGGIRFTDKIANQVDQNLKIIAKSWSIETRPRIESLQQHRGHRREREVANFLQDMYAGVGPKQSRNLLQVLGLTRYEIPLDTRIVKWLNAFGFPIHLSAKGLADISYYEFINDGVRELCSKAKIYPCVLDAAIFSSYDSASWEDKNFF